MPLLKILPSLISQGSFTGSFSGTSSYARRSLTASYVMGGAAGSSGTSGANGSVGSSGTSGTSATAGSSGTSGVGSPGTSGTAGTSGTSSTATLQTGSLAKQTIFYNVTSGSQNVITGLNLSGNKWGVDIKEEWDAKSVTGDQYYNSCSLLLHLNGTNGSTTFTDNSPSPKTVTSNNGAAISTAQSKFGGASAFFDGTDDLVTVSDNSGFDFGSGDFTIEYWEYRTDSSNNKTALARNTSGRTPYMSGYAFSGALYFYVSFDGSNWAFNLNQGDITLNAWNHFAITRQGNVFRTFKNGSQTSTTTTSGTFPAGSAALEIGRWAANAGVYYQGYIDELRITKGVARYTNNFTTSSIAFPNNASLTQYATKYVGLIGGLNDRSVDYGVQKLSDSSLKVVKMTQTTSPLVGSGSLSGSVDRVYVNVLDYTKVSVTSSYSLLSKTASYALNASGGGSTLRTGSRYPITASRAITASYALNGGTALVNQTMNYVSGSNLYILSRSVVSPSDVLLSVNGIIQTPITDYTVSASRVTFTESYPSGSKINARYLVTATNSSDVNLANIVLTGTTTGDAYYPQVSALLHFDGTNGSTTITDNSKNNLTVTSVNGAAISTAQSKFGGSSCFFDGTNDYLSINYNSVFNFGTDSFTWESWIYPTNISGIDGIYATSGGTGANPKFVIHLNAGTPSIHYNNLTNGSDIYTTATSAVSINTWTHLAFVRNGSNWTWYINGNSAGTGTNNTTITFTSQPTYIGYGGESYFTQFNGYIDEMRITKGIARYTSNFTPSTTAFSNTGGDVGKALVVNSTATGVSIGTAGYLSSQLAKAWVNFNGTGTVAIRDSYNVSSITDNGVGDYTINYGTALNNSNYAISGITDYNESGLHRVIVYRSGLSHQYNTLGVRIQIIGQVGSSDNTQDPVFASLMVLGN